MIAFALLHGILLASQIQPEVRAPNPASEYFQNIFVLAIWASFFYSLYKLVTYRVRLRGQSKALARVRHNYEQVQKGREKNPEVIKKDLLDGVNPDSVVAQRVRELHRISIHGGDFDQLALAEVLAAREAAKISIAKYVASVLVLLGLCGAIWGLSRLVYQMGPALNQVQEQMEQAQAGNVSGGAEKPDTMAPVQESFKTLISTMSSTLANTRSAFAASLTGIIFSVLLLLANWAVAQRQVALLTALEDLTATRLIPLFKPPQEAAELASAVNSFKEGANYLVRLSDDLDGKVSQVGESLGELFSVVRKFRDSSEALRVSQTLVHDAQGQMLEVVEKFVGLTSRMESQQSESLAKLDGVVAVVQESNSNISRAIEGWQGNYESVLQVIQQNSRQAQQGINAVAQYLQDSLDRHLGLLRSQSLELQAGQFATNRTHLEEVVTRQGEFMKVLQDAVTSSNGHKELLSGVAEMMKAERDAFGKRLEKMLNQNQAGLKAMVAEQQKLLDISGLKSVESVMREFTKRSGAEFDELLKKQELFLTHFETLGGRAQRLGSVLTVLSGVAAVTLPVFAALGVMFIFDLRPADTAMRFVSLAVIVAMIFMAAWFLRSRE
jgi:hypothetical protein